MPIIKRQFEPSIRRTHGLVIYFRDKECVQVQAGEVYILFHRWLVKSSGFYTRCWGPFCRKLKRSNDLYSIWDIMDIAKDYDINMQTTAHPSSIPKGIIKHPSVYRAE